MTTGTPAVRFTRPSAGALTVEIGGAPPAVPRLQTRLTELLGCEAPIMLAGMGGIASRELVAAVSTAGGFGTWGSAIDVKNMGPDGLRRELAAIRAACGGRPFGVDILVHGKDGGVMDALIDIFAEGGVRAFISGKGHPSAKAVAKFHKRGILVGSIAGRVKHAVGAVRAGVDLVIAQGAEAGGHTGQVALGVLLPQVVDALRGSGVPVVAAGGIYDARGVAAALAMGAEGVWCGTRFMLTPEADTHPLYKAHLLKQTSDATVVTRAYTGAPLRVLKNGYTRAYDAGRMAVDRKEPATVRTLREGCWDLHRGKDVDERGEPELWDRQAFVVGQCIGGIEALKPAGEIVREMTEGAAEILSRGPLSARL